MKLEKKPVSLEINMDNLANNFLEVKRIVSDNTRIMGIVKANSYGHGSVQCAKVFIENGADYLGVSTLSEGIELRNANIKSKILLLNYTPRSDFEKLLEYDLIQTIYNLEDAKKLSELALKINKIANIHIKIDTGMIRLGFLPNEESFHEILKISQLPNIYIDGTYSHFARSDEKDKAFSHEQYTKFINTVNKLENMGIGTGIKHISSSAAIIDLPQYNLDMVRPGIILYGHYPSTEVDKNILNLVPTMALKATLSNIKQVQSGTGISYNQIFKTEKESLIGTLPLGYADGMARRLTGKAKVFIKEEIVPIVGKICMDQMMIDITNVPNASIGDEVTVFGFENEMYTTAEEFAEILDTINYELFCSIGRRIPRVYIEKGRVINVVDYLLD